MITDKDKTKVKHGFTAKKIAGIVLFAFFILAAAGGAAIMKASEKPAFCATCHIMKPYYQSWKSDNLLAQKHAVEDITCHDCHKSSVTTQATEGLKYISGNYKTPLDKRQMSRDFCLECHDMTKVKSKTEFEDANPHESHNGEQQCNLCHSMHQPSKVMCSQCHSFLWAYKLDDSWEK